MMTALDHPLVQDYLHRLREESSRLPVDEAHDLQTQIREHLREALGERPSGARVQQTLDRLGGPAELVDAAGGQTDGASAGPSGSDGTMAAGRGGDDDSAWREAGALVGLVGAGLLFWVPLVNVVLWVGGLVLLVLSRRWTAADKVWGAVVLGLGPLPFILLAGLSWTTSSEVCMSEGAAVPNGGTAPPVVVTCTGGGDGGLTPLNIVVWALTVAYLVLYVWTLVRLVRRAARPGGAVT